MCGIVAYLGKRDAQSVLIEGLKRLEYRGYDSAGVALMVDNEVREFKKKGKVKELENLLSETSLSSTMGVGHTRWATHGPPSDKNAHPHLSSDGSIAVIHNGIIENYQILKNALTSLGHTFQSDTDTEVISHLLQEYRDKRNLSLVEAVRAVLRKLVGAYAIVVMDQNEPDILVGARKSSPLVFGIGTDEYFMASDASPIAGYTNQFIYLDDNQIVAVQRNGEYEFSNLDSSPVTPIIQTLDLKIEELEKGGYPHFMLKEIHQQPQTISDSMRGRVNLEEMWVRVGGMTNHLKRISQAKRIIFAACGTSWHTALIGEYLFEELARIPCEVEYASEFRYRNPILTEKDVLVVISQSGETADTLAALELARSKGVFTYGIVNVVGSSIPRMTHSGSYTHAGPEIGVASTKAFTSQLTVLSLMAIQLGYQRQTISEDKYHQLIHAMNSLPAKAEYILKQDSKIKFIASEIKSAQNALYLGRGYNFPVALEGALKLKEISYIHAEGYPAAEMKHGPIALIDLYMPVIVIATNDSAYEKIVSNVEEVKARKAIVIAIIKEGDKHLKSIVDYYIEVPETEEALSPILSVLPLQLLAYHIAVMRGCDVDQPRNLAKSVTVE